MEYCPGNELYHLLNQTHRLTEASAKFYAAEIISMLEDIHSIGIVYRDLKPENLVFDIYGHLKLVDFGLSTIQNSVDTGRETVCGSKGYMSPEAILQEYCGPVSDFYSLGIIIYEMLTGYPPNYNKRPSSELDLTVKKIKYPDSIPVCAKKLIKGLLNKNPEKRLGTKGIKEIKDHEWFRSINWGEIKKKSIMPPFRPSIEEPLEYYDTLSTTIDESSDEDECESELEN